MCSCVCVCVCVCCSQTGAFFLFLYLDFIGSTITFVSLGEMMGIVDKDVSEEHTHTHTYTHTQAHTHIHKHTWAYDYSIHTHMGAHPHTMTCVFDPAEGLCVCMCVHVCTQGNIPRSNMAFLSDGTASMIGGLMGTSALTT